MSNKNYLLSDKPISKSDEDLFNFKHYAKKVQRIIQKNSSNSEPISIGIFGKWGEGKTSFLNLIENQIDFFKKDKSEKGLLKYHFNPWRYSNEDEMLFDFFEGLSKIMFLSENKSLKKAGNGIIKFSRYLKTIKIAASFGVPNKFGTTVSFEPSVILKTLGEDLRGEMPTIESLKESVDNALKESAYKIVVFIDDIDRLDKNEIYTILKLIKLNADFQNFVYLIALDNEQVSKAISKRYGENVVDGKLFLEKIINIPIQLPRIEKEDLQYFFEVKLNQVINNLTFYDNEKKETEIKEIIFEFSGRYFKSPREILKVLNGFFIGAFAIGDEINIRDLFWLETLKVKNEIFYNELKKYNLIESSGFFENFVDFNDDIRSKENVNGSRKEFNERYKEEFYLFEFIFPIGKTQTVLDKEIDIVKIEKELNINSPNHFEKYFSFHTYRKISRIKFLKIEEFIKNKDSIKLKESLQDLFSGELQHKAFYKFESIVKDIEKDGNRDYLFEFIFENISIIPNSQKDMFGEDYKLRIIQSIAIILDKDRVNENDELIVSLAEKININQLCYFTRKFKDDRGFKKNLIVLIVKKAQEFLNEEIPFFNDANNMPNKMIMHCWKEANQPQFDSYIENKLTDIKRIGNLIRNFAPFWNNKFFGGLELDNYKYLKSLIDVEFVYKKIVELDSTMIKGEKSEIFPFSSHDESTLEDNIKQFIYYFKTDEDFKNHFLKK